MFQDDDTCIFIGGLRRDLSVSKLKSNLILLFKYISIRTKKSQIILINVKKSDYIYGFVDLQDIEAVKFVLHHLSTQAGRDNIDYDYSCIQDPLKKLKFDFKKPPRLTPHEHDDDNARNSEQKVEVKSESIFSLAKSFKQLPFSSPSSADNDTTSTVIQSTGLPAEVNSGKTSITTSVSGLALNLPSKYYSYKESLGNETRTAEFKQGGFVSNSHKYMLQDNVGKYVCAFLNTSGGTLYVGVDNNGRVVGIRCDQAEEDKYRLSIDQALKVINPPVLPNMYTVDFVPVLDDNTFHSNLKVLEIKVSNHCDHSELYVYHNDAYIRRDGSVQHLRTRDVQYWERQKQDQSEDGRQEVLQMLGERTQQVQRLQEQIAELKRLRDTRKPSKVCVMM